MYLSAIKNIFSAKGRMNRGQFLTVFLFISILIFLDILISLSPYCSYEISTPGMIFLLLLILLFIPTTIKRLHDIDWSGWLVVIYLLFSPILILIPGDDKENKYGLPQPSLKIGTILLNIITVATLGWVLLFFCYGINEMAKNKFDKCHAYPKEHQMKLPDLTYNAISNPVLAQAMWDTADEEHKMFINSYKGGLSYYDMYVPSLDLMIRINTTDRNEIIKNILLNEATIKEEKDIIRSNSYVNNRDTTYIYTGPKDNFMTVIENIIAQIINGIKTILVKEPNESVTGLDELISKISSTDIDTETKLVVLADSDSKYGWNILSEEKQQEILKSAYVEYMKNREEEFESNCKHSGKIIQACVRLWKKTTPSENYLRQIEMFKKLIKEPLETVYNPNSNYDISSQEIEQAVKELKESSKFVKLMLELHPEILQEAINLIKEFNEESLKAPNENLTIKELTSQDLVAKIPLIDRKFNEYVQKAPDKELYDVYYTDYKRMKKNGCTLYLPAPKDVKEASEVKYNLVMAARKNPQLYKPISQQEKEKIITKIVKIHRDKKYNLQNFQLMASGQVNSLSEAEECQTEINFWDSIFSLPKKESLIMIREMALAQK